MPLFVSTEGYGILFDCCSFMTFNDEGRSPYLFLDTVDQIDYYFMGGNTMDGIIHAYRYLTGKAQMLPKWAYGYIQSKGAILYFQRIRENCTPLQRNRGSAGLCGSGLEYWDPGNWGGEDSGSVRYGDNKECMGGFMRCMPIPWFPYGRI